MSTTTSTKRKKGGPGYASASKRSKLDKNAIDLSNEPDQTGITSSSTESVIPTSVSFRYDSNTFIKEFTESMLMCTICMDYMRKEIFQCQNGHKICEKCVVSIKTTPGNQRGACTQRCSDRTAIAGRDFGTEKLRQFVLIPCYYSENGCTELIQADKEHKECQFSKKLCPNSCRGCTEMVDAATMVHVNCAYSLIRWPYNEVTYETPEALLAGLSQKAHTATGVINAMGQFVMAIKIEISKLRLTTQPGTAYITFKYGDRTFLIVWTVVNDVPMSVVVPPQMNATCPKCVMLSFFEVTRDALIKTGERVKAILRTRINSDTIKNFETPIVGVDRVFRASRFKIPHEDIELLKVPTPATYTHATMQLELCIAELGMTASPVGMSSIIRGPQSVSTYLNTIQSTAPTQQPPPAASQSSFSAYHIQQSMASIPSTFSVPLVSSIMRAVD